MGTKQWQALAEVYKVFASLFSTNMDIEKMCLDRPDLPFAQVFASVVPIVRWNVVKVKASMF